MLIALCIACRYGDHEGHVPRVSSPEGMLGGSECPCKGDCEMQPEIAQQVAAVAAASTGHVDTEPWVKEGE